MLYADWANLPCIIEDELVERPCGIARVFSCVPTAIVEPSPDGFKARRVFNEDVLEGGWTVSDILGMLDCGHGHMGICRTLCHRCFTRWPPGLQDLSMRTLWCSTAFDWHGETIYKEKWEHTGKGNANGYWKTITHEKCGRQRTADVRFCGRCCGGMWKALQPVIVRREMVGPGDLPPAFNVQFFSGPPRILGRRRWKNAQGGSIGQWRIAHIAQTITGSLCIRHSATLGITTTVMGAITAHRAVASPPQ